MQTLNLALIQTHTLWHDAAGNRALFDDLLTQLPADTDLVLLPEMFSTGFTMASQEVAEPMNGPTAGWLSATAERLGAVICGSLVIEQQGHYYNRFLWAAPGEPLAGYDKRHRFRMAGEHQYYAAGGRRIVLPIKGWRVCPMICYDLRFPVWFRNRGDYDLLICVANWPAARQQAWNTLLRARAIENQVYAAGVNIVGIDGNGVEYAGGSAVYAPDGAVLAERLNEGCIINVQLDGALLTQLREQFPVADDADDFELLE